MICIHVLYRDIIYNSYHPFPVRFGHFKKLSVLAACINQPEYNRIHVTMTCCHVSASGSRYFETDVLSVVCLRLQLAVIT